MLKDRMIKENSLNDKEKADLIKSIKEDIKKEKVLDNKVFINREDFKDKIYLALSNKINLTYPYHSFTVDDDLLDMTLAEIFGLGVLEQYLRDEKVTDIFINDTELIIIKNGKKKNMGYVFKSIEDVFLIIDRIKNHTGKTIDQRIPFLNTELYDGSRCSIVIPPASDKVYLSVRVFNCVDFKLEDLHRLKMFNTPKLNILKSLISEQKNILISGAMGSGKTTLLNTLAKLIPKNEFINIIQDVPEIRLKDHPYVRQLNTRPKSREIDNEITQRKLLFETLRMKADRIILGEVRESMAAYHMLQALNTGHKGSFGTIHADSAIDSLLRLETLTMEYSRNINHLVAKKMISRAIDIIIFLEIVKDKNFHISHRRIKEIVKVGGKLDEHGGYILKHL